MALGTVPPIAAMMLLAMEGCRGTIMKSCFGRKVFRLRVAVGSSEAPGMRVSVSCCRSPSNETCASPASSSIKASSRRLLSCTFQNLKGPSTREFYHHEPAQFPTQRVRLGSPQLRYVLVNGITGNLKSLDLASKTFYWRLLQFARPCPQVPNDQLPETPTPYPPTLLLACRFLSRLTCYQALPDTVNTLVVRRAGAGAYHERAHKAQTREWWCQKSRRTKPRRCASAWWLDRHGAIFDKESRSWK